MNLLVIVADQLRADHLGCYGNSIVRTPNIDSIARSGHRFDRAFVANPVCMPNRATIMTGRWPSAHGLRTNGLPLDPSSDTFARVLRKEGWSTSAVGKLHLQPMGWPFEEWQLDEIKAVLPHLYERAVTGPFGEDFESWEDYGRHSRENVTLPDDYYGFDNVALTTGHGDRMAGNYLAWARERGVDPLSIGGSKNSPDRYSGWPGQVYQSAVPAALHPTSYVTEEAVTRMRSFAENGKPWLLFVSFPDPHHPFAPPEEYWRRHDPADMPIPASFHDSHEDSPEHIKRIVSRRGTPDADPTMTWAPTEEQFRHALAAELGSIEFIDDSVGMILDQLTALGAADDTAIVFTADHGDVFGDHGLLLKHFTHYQGVVRVPLLISSPGYGEGTHEALVSSADIAPTLLDMAHAPELHSAQGTSLVPLMTGEVDSLHERILIEEDQPFGLDGLPGPVRIRTVITDSLRLTEIQGRSMSELYDHDADSGEQQNLAGINNELESIGRNHLVQALMQVIDDSVVPFDAA